MTTDTSHRSHPAPAEQSAGKQAEAATSGIAASPARVSRRQRRGGLKVSQEPPERPAQWNWWMIALGVSLVLHVVVGFVLGLYVLDRLAARNLLTITASEAEGVPVKFEKEPGEEILAEFNRPPDEPVPAVPPLIDPNATPPSIDVAVDEALFGDLGEAGGGGENPGTLPKAGAPPAGAVTKGSFTAWTVPRNPELKQSYQIWIQVRLPEKITRYKASDLDGVVIGTDGHRQQIPWDGDWPGSALYIHPRTDRLTRLQTGGWLPLREHMAYLVVRVPGSRIPRTRDTIEISSRLLQEKQVLELEFQGRTKDER